MSRTRVKGGDRSPGLARASRSASDLLAPYLVGLGGLGGLLWLSWGDSQLRHHAWYLFALATAIATGCVLMAAAAGVVPGDRGLTTRKAIVLTLVVVVPVAFDPRTVEAFNVVKASAIALAAVGLGGLWLVQLVDRGRSRPGGAGWSGRYWRCSGGRRQPRRPASALP